LRFCLSDLVIIKAVPARTCTARGLDLGEQTLNAKGAERLAEEVLEIADEKCSDKVQVLAARNRIDARKWLTY
jgi:hypothetical protein